MLLGPCRAAQPGRACASGRGRSRARRRPPRSARRGRPSCRPSMTTYAAFAFNPCLLSLCRRALSTCHSLLPRRVSQPHACMHACVLALAVLTSKFCDRMRSRAAAAGAAATSSYATWRSTWCCWASTLCWRAATAAAASSAAAAAAMGAAGEVRACACAKLGCTAWLPCHCQHHGRQCLLVWPGSGLRMLRKGTMGCRAGL